MLPPPSRLDSITSVMLQKVNSLKHYHTSQISQQNGLWEFVAMRSLFFFFFCHFDWRNGFLLLSLLSFCYCDLLQKRNFYAETKINIWKGCPMITSDLLIGWQFRALTQNTRCITVLKCLSSLFFTFYILTLFFLIFHILEVNSMFGIWICGLRKLYRRTNALHHH